MQLAYYMALRPSETLNLRKSNIRREGFLVELTKTKNSMPRKLIKWTPTLKKIINEIQVTNKSRIGNIDFLLVNREGQPFTHDAFLKYWGQTIKEALKKEIIKERFQFRDIRHKAATDMERLKGREAARHFLGHMSQNTTARYIDGISVIEGFL